VIEAAGGTVTLAGLVSGAGHAVIAGGLFDCQSAFIQNVTFTTATGILELHDSRTYTGTIAGFSAKGGTSLDLTDIKFVSSAEASYSGTKTGGVLSVTDGKNVAHIDLTGDYTAATFAAASDGVGGVLVQTSATAIASNAPIHRFVARMASMAGAPAAPLGDGYRCWAEPHNALAAPNRSRPA
jgi:hypothetical protein